MDTNQAHTIQVHQWDATHKHGVNVEIQTHNIPQEGRARIEQAAQTFLDVARNVVLES